MYCELCGDMLTPQDQELPTTMDICNHCYLHMPDNEEK